MAGLVQPDRTTDYARAVGAGTIVAGELVIAACKRHLADLIGGPARGLDWRPIAAEKMIDSYPAYFTITDGPAAGQPFELLDWMLFVTGSLFGWYRGDRLRFDEAYIETAKGQGKSPWMATTGILGMAALGRPRALVIVTGPKDDQAMVTMGDAAAAVQSDLPGEDEGVTLVSQGKFVVRGVGDNAHKIEHPKTKSVFKTWSGNATKVSGPRPFIVFVDEGHELVSTGLVDMWQAALAKNARGGLLILCTNTPATSQAVGTYYSERAQRVALGLDTLDTLFVFIARVDIADRDTVFDTPACWVKAMPALGITFPPENIRREVDKALNNPSEAARVKRLYFGIPTGAVEFWLDDSTLWDRALVKVDETALVNLRCWLSLDLSEKHDLTALTATWELPSIDGLALPPLVSKTWYWTVAANLEKRARADQMPYDIWAAGGHLAVVPGASISKDYVAVEVARLVEEQQIEFLAFDVAGLDSFIEACGRIGLAVWRYKGPTEPSGRGLKLVAHAQGTRMMMQEKQLCMPRSIEATEDALRLEQLTIDDNPVTYACASNAAPISDAVGNRAFDKTRSRGRIDGLVTTVMGVGAARMNAAALPPSIYTTRGILAI